MVRALARPEAEQIRLLLAGDGPERAAIEALARDLGVLDRVVMLGQIPHEELLGLYDRGDVDVTTLASEIEGIPVSLIEALGRGVPVVASRVGSVDELVTDEVGRLIDDPHDAPGFARAWAEVGAWDPEEVAPRARQVVAERFDIRRTAASLLALMTPRPT
jgi:glycosyltransferase involved in cell wall biosynthesis